MRYILLITCFLLVHVISYSQYLLESGDINESFIYSELESYEFGSVEFKAKHKEILDHLSANFKENSSKMSKEKEIGYVKGIRSFSLMGPPYHTLREKRKQAETINAFTDDTLSRKMMDLEHDIDSLLNRKLTMVQELIKVIEDNEVSRADKELAVKMLIDLNENDAIHYLFLNYESMEFFDPKEIAGDYMDFAQEVRGFEKTALFEFMRKYTFYSRENFHDYKYKWWSLFPYLLDYMGQLEDEDLGRTWSLSRFNRMFVASTLKNYQRPELLIEFMLANMETNPEMERILNDYLKKLNKNKIDEK